MAAFTILFASAKAVHEQHLKRRLAYSTISNLSYMLFGLMLLTPLGLKAGLMHMIFHSLVKITLFSCAGAIMVQTGREYVQELRGLRRQMPIVTTVFAFCAVELVGIPAVYHLPEQVGAGHGRVPERAYCRRTRRGGAFNLRRVYSGLSFKTGSYGICPAD